MNEATDNELRQIYLFAELNEQQLARVKQGMRTVRLDAGERLFDHGRQADRFYFVRAGQIKLFRLSAGGIEKVIEIMRPGQTFAEAVMFMESHSYPVNAEAIEESRLWSFDNRGFLQILRESGDTCFRLMAGMSQRLHQRLTEIDHLTLQNATFRFVNYLLREIDGTPQTEADVRLGIPKSVLASRLSIQPETFSRILHNLSREGLISVEGKTIHVHDAHRLQAYGQ